MARITKPTRTQCRRFDPRGDLMQQQQRFLDRQVEDGRRRRLLRFLYAEEVRRVERHAAEYPAGPTAYGEQDFHEWLQTRNSSRDFDPHWSFATYDDDDDCPLSVRSAEPCHRCRANPRVLREPYDSCSLCTTRDMCYVQFRNGKVILARNPEDRWGF